MPLRVKAEDKSLTCDEIPPTILGGNSHESIRTLNFSEGIQTHYEYVRPLYIVFVHKSYLVCNIQKDAGDEVD